MGSISLPSLPSLGAQWPFPRRVVPSSGGGARRPAPPGPRTETGRHFGGDSVIAPAASPAVGVHRLPAGYGSGAGSQALLPGLWARLFPSRQPASPTRPRPLQPAPRGARLGDRPPRLSCFPGPSSPRTLIVSSWGGRAEGAPGPCIIRGFNGPAARAGLRGAGGGAADPARVWLRRRGALLSSSGDSSPPPLGLGPRGAGSRRVVGLVQGRGSSLVHSCNFCFGGREASSEMEPLRDPLPKELGELECRFPPSILQPSSYFPPPPDPFSPPPAAPCRPPAPQQPGELALGPGPAPFPGSGRRWMEAETQGQGRGARGPGAPLCARVRPSSTRPLLPDPQTRARSSDLPGRGELHFRTPENSCQWSHPQKSAREGRGSSLGWRSFLGIFLVLGAHWDPLFAPPRTL